MNPHIAHHNGCARLNYIWEWSIHYCSLSAMFYPLHRGTNQELFESTSVITVATMKNTMVPRAPVIIWNWSIHYPSLSPMFDSLQSSTNQELFKKNVCKHSSHYEKYDVAVHPIYRQLKYPLPFSVTYVWLVIHSSTNQEVFEKHLCNKSSHYEKYGLFSLRKGSHHMQPPN